MTDQEAPASPSPPFWRRLLWFGGLWLAGVATLAAIGFLIRIWLT